MHIYKALPLYTKQVYSKVFIEIQKEDITIINKKYHIDPSKRPLSTEEQKQNQNVE